MTVIVCPKCQTKLRFDAEKSAGKVICTGCGVTLNLGKRAAANAPPQAAVAAGKPAPKSSARVALSPPADQEESNNEESSDEPRKRRERTKKKKKKAGLSVGAIALIVGGGLFLLFGALAVIGIVVMMSRGKNEMVLAKPDAMVVAQKVPAPLEVKPPPAPEIAPAPPKQEQAPQAPPAVALVPGEMPPGWKEYAPNMAFSAWIPVKGKFYEANRTISVPSAGFMRIKIAHVELQGGPNYTVGLLALPALATQKVQPGDWMDIFRDSHVKETKGTLTKETDVSQGKIAGKEYIVQYDKGISRLRLFLAKGNVYRAEVSGDQAQVDSPESQMFLDSLKLPWHETGLPPTIRKK